MLGLLQIMKLFERSTKLYDSCLGSDDIENEYFADNTLMHNLLYICQNNPKTEENDGFPLVHVIFRIVKTCLNIIETK